MKVKVSKQELKECIKNAVVRALTEQKNQKIIKEYYEDDDEMSSLVDKFCANPKNNPKYDASKGKVMKRVKGGAAAQKAAEDDIRAELAAQKKDDDALERHEREEMDKD